MAAHPGPDQCRRKNERMQEAHIELVMADGIAHAESRGSESPGDEVLPPSSPRAG